MEKLLEKQEHALWYLRDDETTEVIYGGAAGGGKTAFGCLWLIENCQMYPGSRWLMGRAEIKQLKLSTMKTFFELTNKLGVADQFVYKEKGGIILHENGSEIILMDLSYKPSDPDYTDLGGVEITGGFIDECNAVSLKAWNIAKSRMRYKLIEFDLMPKIFGTCNPSKGWIYNQFYKPFKEDRLEDNRRFIQALPTDNPHLPKSYLDSLLQMDENSVQRLYYGNWEYDNDPSALMSLQAITDYFNPVHVQPGSRRYITCDVARKGKDNTIIRIWYGWLCIKRIQIPVCSLDQIVARLRKEATEHSVPISNIIADEDGVGGGVVDFLKCRGFINNSRALNSENYSNLKSQCSIEMAKKIELREVGEICHDTAARESVTQEMEQIKMKDLDKDGKLSIIPKDIIKKNIGRSPDDWDSIMMRYWFEYTPTTPKLFWF